MKNILKKTIAFALFLLIYSGIFAQETSETLETSEITEAPEITEITEAPEITETPETKRAKNRIGFSAGFYGVEFAYERAFSPYFSVLASFSYDWFLFCDGLNISAKPRWYTNGKIFYLEMGIGFSYGRNFWDAAPIILGDFLWFFIPSALNENLYDDYDFKYHGGFLIQPGLGWTIDVSKKDRFYLPINMGLDMRINNKFTVMPYIRVGFCYAF